MEYKIGDKVIMGFKRRTFLEWLRNESPQPKEWVVTQTIGSGHGSLAYIEPQQ